MPYFLAPYAPVVLLLNRLLLGAIMIYFGWPKIKDLKSNAQDFVDMGFKPGWFWGTPIAFLEFFGGLMVMIGLIPWLPATLMVIHMATGATWKITKTNKKFSDWSYDLALAALSLILLTFGAGALALTP